MASTILPWQNVADISIATNEYAQISVYNRCFKRLLENDKWLKRFAIVVTDDKMVADSGKFTAAGKYFEIEVVGTNEKLYFPLYHKA